MPVILPYHQYRWPLHVFYPCACYCQCFYSRTSVDTGLRTLPSSRITYCDVPGATSATRHNRLRLYVVQTTPAHTIYVVYSMATGGCSKQPWATITLSLFHIGGTYSATCNAWLTGLAHRGCVGTTYTLTAVCMRSVVPHNSSCGRPPPSLIRLRA